MTIAAIAMAVGIEAQEIDSILACIERNNVELQALRKGNEAEILEIRSQNNLEDPSVEYSPFFQSGVSGMASSELVVSQSFDFPTVYAARNKAGRLRQEAIKKQYNASRRDILLNAKTLCIDLVYQNKRKELIDKRRDNANELLNVFEQRLDNGMATILEVNKIKMDRMNMEAEAVQAESEREATMQALTALNGNKPMELTPNAYPAMPDDDEASMLAMATAADHDVLAAEASARAYGQEVKVNKQNWIPQLEVGYRRNTDGDDASNGFLVGASFPLFSGRNKLKAAKAQEESALLQIENAKIKAESDAKANIQKLKQLKSVAMTYDVELMDSTLSLLRKAVVNGEISIVEYYAEADAVYQNMETLLEIEWQCQGIVANIYKNDL